MPTGLNRALQVRTADRLRAELAYEQQTGLPQIAALSAGDQRELCEAGGGRLAAVAIKVDSWIIDPAERASHVQAVPVLTVREVVSLVGAHIRRTDLLAALSASTLVVLAPGLEPVGGRSLADRLRNLFVSRTLDVAGEQVYLRVHVGTAYRSLASPSGWTVAELAALAELSALAEGQPTDQPAIESVA
jgi:GGDEF domain-containing protein